MELKPNVILSLSVPIKRVISAMGQGTGGCTHLFRLSNSTMTQKPRIDWTNWMLATQTMLEGFQAYILEMKLISSK